MVFLILESHRPLDFRGGIDKLAQRVARQRMVIASLVHILEGLGVVVLTLRVNPVKQKALDLVGCIQRIAVFLVHLLRELLEDAANVRAIRSARLLDHVAEDQHLARPEYIRGCPVERAPVDSQAKIALLLRSKAADRGPVEGQVVIALDQELLVVVEHVQPAFEVAEQNGDGLDARLVGEILQPFLLDGAGDYAVLALFLGHQVQVFQLRIRKFQKITIFVRHDAP